MKKLISFFVLCFSLTGLSKSFDVDPSNSDIGFSIMEFKIENAVVGEFKTYSGTYDFDPSSMILKDVNITIETSSINTNEDKRDNHLKGDPAFFNVKKYKTITFKSDMPIKLKLQKLVVVPGLLKIKETEKRISLSVMFQGMEGDRPKFIASSNINRHDFKVSWNKNLNKKDNKSLIKRLTERFKRFAGKVLDDNVKVNITF